MVKKHTPRGVPERLREGRAFPLTRCQSKAMESCNPPRLRIQASEAPTAASQSGVIEKRAISKALGSVLGEGVVQGEQKGERALENFKGNRTGLSWSICRSKDTSK